MLCIVFGWGQQTGIVGAVRLSGLRTRVSHRSQWIVTYGLFYFREFNKLETNGNHFNEF